MKGPLVLCVWGALLLTGAAVQLLFSPRSTTVALLGGAGAAAVLGGLAWRRASASTDGAARGAAAPAGTSPGAATLATGVGLAALGSAVSPWFVAAGAGVTVAGIVLLRTEPRR
jgi:hypothetical protein